MGVGIDILLSFVSVAGRPVGGEEVE